MRYANKYFAGKSRDISSSTSTTMNTVEILFNGFSKNLSENVMEANCTTTLIRGSNTCVIVDTRTAWDGDELKTSELTLSL